MTTIPVFEMVDVPVPEDMAMPVPATLLRTPVFWSVIPPVEPVVDRPLPTATLVTPVFDKVRTPLVVVAERPLPDAVAERRPVLEIVDVPVAEETPMPVPATLLVTPLFVIPMLLSEMEGVSVMPVPIAVKAVCRETVPNVLFS